jgi:type II secretory pathway component PulC
MTRMSSIGLCLSLLALASSGHADDKRIETASLEVRAWGNHGEVRRLRSPQRPTSDRPLVREVNAGVIPRASLQAQLALGIGRFLRQVRTEPAFANGHWKGWRLIALFPNVADVQSGVLRTGDTVTRVNGQSIERPEDFKSLWDSLSSATQLVLDIERDGKASKLRYTITP